MKKFFSDEIDIEFLEFVEENKNIEHYTRAECPNDSETYINALSSVVLSHISKNFENSIRDQCINCNDTTCSSWRGFFKHHGELRKNRLQEKQQAYS